MGASDKSPARRSRRTRSSTICTSSRSCSGSGGGLPRPCRVFRTATAAAASPPRPALDLGQLRVDTLLQSSSEWRAAFGPETERQLHMLRDTHENVNMNTYIDMGMDIGTRTGLHIVRNLSMRMLTYMNMLMHMRSNMNMTMHMHVAQAAGHLPQDPCRGARGLQST